MADQAGTGNAAQIEFWNSAATRAWADQYARMDRAVAALTKELGCGTTAAADMEHINRSSN